MSVDFNLSAEPRADIGKGASRRLRRAGKVPAVLYGGNKDPEHLTLEHHIMLQHIEHEAFYSHILDLNVGSQTQKAVLKDMQRHPFKPVIMHMDFQRVDESSIIKMHVPLHFIGEDKAPGVKAGGVVSHQLTNVEVTCPAGKLPEFLEVDVSALNIGDSVHLSQIALPDNVTLVELSHGPEHDLPIVTIVATRASAAAEEESEGE